MLPQNDAEAQKFTSEEESDLDAELAHLRKQIQQVGCAVLCCIALFFCFVTVLLPASVIFLFSCLSRAYLRLGFVCARA